VTMLFYRLGVNVLLEWYCMQWKLSKPNTFGTIIFVLHRQVCGLYRLNWQNYQILYWDLLDVCFRHNSFLFRQDSSLFRVQFRWDSGLFRVQFRQDSGLLRVHFRQESGLFRVQFRQDSDLFRVQFRHDSGLFRVQFRQDSGLFRVQFRQDSGLFSVQFRQDSGLVSVQFRQISSLVRVIQFRQVSSYFVIISQGWIDTRFHYNQSLPFNDYKMTAFTILVVQIMK
jgi:hypothetical protein